MTSPAHCENGHPVEDLAKILEAPETFPVGWQAALACRIDQCPACYEVWTEMVRMELDRELGKIGLRHEQFEQKLESL